MSQINIPHKKILSAFALCMIAVAAIIDLRALPLMATYGFSVIFIYGVAAILFFIPSGLVSAELSTHIREPGGMYVWIRSAFGDKAGFFSIWLEWLNNVIGFPASLTFITVTLSYLIDPALAQNKVWILTLTLTILWAVTLFTLLGVRASSRLNMLGAIVGTIIPAFIIIAMSFTWILLGNPTQIALDSSQVVPSLNASNPGYFAAVILGFGGMQIVAFHTVNVRDPRRTFPRSIFAAMFLVVTIALFTTLAIAVVVPKSQLNLVSGLIDGFSRFFTAFHITWATPIVVLMIILSMLATLNAWFLGPARGLAVAVGSGYLPEFLGNINKHDVPANIIVLQAIVGTLLSTFFWYMPDISSAFWVLLNLSSQSALLVYLFIFSSAIRLRYTRVSMNFPGYTIPGGNLGMWFVAGIGFLTCFVALVASVVPPSFVKADGVLRYETILMISNLVFLGIPLLILAFYSNRKRMAGLAEEK